MANGSRFVARVWFGFWESQEGRQTERPQSGSQPASHPANQSFRQQSPSQPARQTCSQPASRAASPTPGGQPAWRIGCGTRNRKLRRRNPKFGVEIETRSPKSKTAGFRKSRPGIRNEQSRIHGLGQFRMHPGFIFLVWDSSPVWEAWFRIPD